VKSYSTQKFKNQSNKVVAWVYW